MSKEQALADFQAARAAQGQEDLSDLYRDFNPFPAYFCRRAARTRASHARSWPCSRARPVSCARVLGQQTGIDRLVNLTGLLRNLGAIVLAFVGLTVLLIVINSIRMALMSRAQEIEIMRLVGASDRYVRWPFILEGVFIGLAGAVITLLLLLIASRAHQRPGQRDRRPGAARLRPLADAADRHHRPGRRPRARRRGRLDQRADLPAALTGRRPQQP